jgi:hypothetical protein
MPVKRKKVSSAPRKYFTVDPPEGIRVFMEKSFCSDVIPKGHTLEFIGVRGAATPASGKKQEMFVILNDIEGQRNVRLPYEQVEQFRKDGVLRE